MFNVLRSNSSLFIPRIWSSVTRACSDVKFNEKTINQVTLLGRVGSDPETKGTEVTAVSFSVATNTPIKAEDEGELSKTEWHRIVVFKPSLKRIVSSFLRRGDRVMVQGRLKYSQFRDVNGTTRNSTSVIANDVIFLRKGREEEIDQETESVTANKANE
ncbi:single-stranded DNA-binding protein-like isoform X2 [Leptotrombidium deliense]|uniref:Single-stranded DNA-binding protein-like isoform X2 n=1 Tax=Leptotrombidium deliense TaxID=299467 RepID=A0A443SA52_9ACAR|nr:single-stranded DNA-binding protein-like isoform X2 [Leptotrombidium deliense]